MEYFYLFVSGAILFAVILYQYDKKASKNVRKILKDNKNVPQLLMQRSAEQKLVALRAALNRLDILFEQEKDDLCYVDQYVSAMVTEKKTIALQLDLLIMSYRNEKTTLNDYYAKLGALLIRVNELKPELQNV
jgi:hypothetical protein